jgi:enterochelin esterase-like enzyme
MDEQPPSPASRRRWTTAMAAIGARASADRSNWAGVGRALLPLLAGALTLLLAVASRTPVGVEDALGSMGFDRDRSVLITALVIGAAVAAAATVPRGRSALAILAGVAAAARQFGWLFVRETRTALAAGGDQGRFDPAGWLTTLVALLVVATLVAAAAAALATALRASILSAIRGVADVRLGRASRRSLTRPAVVVISIIAVIVTLPVFGDLVNYEPDVLFTAGGPALVGLVGPQVLPGGPTPGPSVSPADLQPALIPGATSGPTIDTARPWLAWRPTGAGALRSVTFPAPWIGGTASTATVDVYTPPGYPDGARRYPVLYEAPWGANSYVRGAHFTDALDGLIRNGSIPASLVVFVSEHGGPFADSECVNSSDGREWFERYLTTTVVPWVDAHFQTIQSPAARALFGFSYGGYCAPMLMLRHPDLFSTAIAFSGYFEAAIASGETPSARLPYGGNQSLIAATSPILEVTSLPAAVRPFLFLELSGSPTEAFFGPQYRAFGAAVRGSGVALALFPTPLGHSWSAVRAELTAVLETLAAREVQQGVFGA